MLDVFGIIPEEEKIPGIDTCNNERSVPQDWAGVHVLDFRVIQRSGSPWNRFHRADQTNASLQ